MPTNRINVQMETYQDPNTMDYIVRLRIPITLTRTDGEFKWRVIQAIALALTERETKYAGADTAEGLTALLAVEEGCK